MRAATASAFLAGCMFLSSYAFAASGIVYDPINWVQNLQSAVSSVRAEVSMAQDAIAQARMLQNSVVNLQRLGKENFTGQLGIISGEISKWGKYNTSIADLSKSIDAELKAVRTLEGIYGASTKSPDALIKEINDLATRGDRRAVSILKDVQDTAKDTNARIEERQRQVGALASTEGQTQTMHAVGTILAGLASTNEAQLIAINQKRAQEAQDAGTDASALRNAFGQMEQMRRSGASTSPTPMLNLFGSGKK